MRISLCFCFILSFTAKFVTYFIIVCDPSNLFLKSLAAHRRKFLSIVESFKFASEAQGGENTCQRPALTDPAPAHSGVRIAVGVHSAEIDG